MIQLLMDKIAMKPIRCYPILHTVIYLILLLGTVWILPGCKDTEATHDAGLLETCNILLNERNWEDAIDACDEVDTDEGKHLTAIAYMGRSGLTMATILTELTDSSSTPSSLIFDYIPSTDTQLSDFKKALYIIMGEIEVKDQSMYLEGILLSSLLIFKELKTLLDLSLVGGELGTCAGDPADITKCNFAPTMVEVYSTTYSKDVPGKIVFGGLGAAFYEGICDDLTSDSTIADSSTDTTTVLNTTLDADSGYGAIAVDVTYDVTVDSAPIKSGSALYYNKIASQEYAKVGKEDLSSLAFYGKMDTGINFAIAVSPLPAVKFCNTGAIATPDVSDDILSDCEILSFLEDPGF